MQYLAIMQDKDPISMRTEFLFFLVRDLIYGLSLDSLMSILHLSGVGRSRTSLEIESKI